MTFNELNISKQILMALEDAGFEQPTPIQERAFPVIRSGKDVIGIVADGVYGYPLCRHLRRNEYPDTASCGIRGSRFVGNDSGTFYGYLYEWHYPYPSD